MITYHDYIYYRDISWFQPYLYGTCGIVIELVDGKEIYAETNLSNLEIDQKTFHSSSELWVSPYEGASIVTELLYGATHINGVLTLPILLEKDVN